MIVWRASVIAVLILAACGPSMAPQTSATASASPLSSPTASPLSPLIVLADMDSGGVTHDLKLYDLEGSLVATFPLPAGTWPLAAAGKRIFVQKSNRLEAIDRTGSIQDLGPLTVGPNEVAYIVPSPDGTHWLQAINGSIHEAGDGMSDRVVATAGGNSSLQVYAWTSAAALIIHVPGFPFDVLPSPFTTRSYIGSVDTLDVASGVSTSVAASAQCKPGDVSAQGAYVCFVPKPNDPTAAAASLRVIPAAGPPIDVPLPQSLFTEAGAAWFSPSGKVFTLGGWDGSGFHTYLVDLAGTITPFGPAGAQPALDAQTWLPGGKILLQRKPPDCLSGSCPVGAAGGDPGLYTLDANGQGPFIADPSRPIGVIS